MITNTNLQKLVVDCLSDLSDLDFQQRVWVRGEGPEESSLVETILGLFDDSGLGDELDDEHGLAFSIEADRILKRLRTLLEEVEKLGSISTILEAQEWAEVLDTARRARDLVRVAIAGMV